MGEGHRDHLSKILMKTFAEAEIFFFFLTFTASPFFHPRTCLHLPRLPFLVTS